MTAHGEPNSNLATPSDGAEQLEIFKVLVEMADRTSQRRQSNNNFYLSVNTATIAASAYLSATIGTEHPTFVISIAGIVICVAWGWSIESYRRLSRAKYAVIHAVERNLRVQPFAEEWRHLTGGTGHLPFHRVEVVVPWVFGGVHAAQLLGRFAGHWPAGLRV